MNPTLRNAAAFAALWVVLAAPATAGASADRRALQEALAAYEAGDLPQARTRFETLAARGLPAAHHNLAMMLLRAEAASNNEAARRQRVLGHLQSASRGGFVASQLTLAQLHDQGTLGPRDPRLALRWFERAARNGNVDGQVAAATAYYLGRGTARDAPRALRWYRRAAQAGDVGAQYIVASMYESGDGVARNLSAAAFWYDAAAANGDIAASAKLKALAAR